MLSVESERWVNLGQKFCYGLGILLDEILRDRMRYLNVEENDVLVEMETESKIVFLLQDRVNWALTQIDENVGRLG